MEFLKSAFHCFIFTLLSLLFTSNVAAQGTSNKGTDFWVAYAGHVDNTNSRLTLFITSEYDAKVSITAGDTALPQVSIIANQAQAVNIDPTVIKNVYVGNRDVLAKGKGIHITSDKSIVVYSLISHSARSAACLVYPTRALGSDYYAISYVQIADSGGEFRSSQFTVVGVEDNTEIEITPSVDSRWDLTRKAGVPFTITLDKGDVYQYQSTSDLSGSRLRTVNGCKPFAVFSGSSKNGFCEDGNSTTNNPSGQDNLYQQLLPVSAWGKNFVSAPFYNTLHGSTDIYRIQVAEDNTIVNVNGSATSANGTMLNNPYAKGSVITFQSQSANVIQANKPINVTQFQTSQNCNPQNVGTVRYPGDPEMTILNPIEQTLKDVTVYSAVSTTAAPTSIRSHYINVIIKTVDAPSLTIDGAKPPGNFVPINSEYSYIVVDVTASSLTINPTHRIKADGGFVAVAYGYGSFESYGYLAGSDLKNLNKFIQPENAATQEPLTAGCVNKSFDLYAVLPYQTLSLTWDLGDGVLITDPEPDKHFTTIVIDGETLYKYKYFGPMPNYSKAGTYPIKVLAVNPRPIGCVADEVISLSYEVFDLPEADFNIGQPACMGQAVTFTDKSSGKGRSVKKWIWDFGDGSPVETRLSADPFPHTYKKSGDYSVQLRVETESGCVSSIMHNVHIAPAPAASFNTSVPLCETREVIFTDKSTSQEGAIVKWHWDFGDTASSNDNTSDVRNPSHIYSAAGIYNVTLTIETDLGCRDTTTLEVKINPLPLPDFTIPEVCVTDAAADFKNISTIANGTESGFTYRWDFGDPASGIRNTSTAKDGLHLYPRDGEFTVKLTVTSPAGCAVTKEKKIIVNGLSPVPEFAMSENRICSGNEVVFEDKSTVNPGKIARIEWYFNETEYPNSPEYKLVEENPENVTGRKYRFRYPVSHNTKPKIINVRMRAFSGESCFSDKIHQLTLLGIPQIEFNAMADVCELDEPFMMNAREINGFEIRSQRYSGSGVSPDGLFNPKDAGVGTHVITYTFISTDGCTAEQSQTITVKPVPIIVETKDAIILKGGEIELAVKATGDNLKYKWTPSEGLDNDSIANPIASPVGGTNYLLSISNGPGCVVTANVFVKVKESPDIPNAFSPNGDGINDTWSIPYLETLRKATIQIFNRYGQIVFYSGQYTAPWDGTFKGKEVPFGVYYYIIEPNNGRNKHVGSITLIK